MTAKYQPGDKFEVRYPFCRVERDESAPFDSGEWRPGCLPQYNTPDFDVVWFAHGHGQMLLEVVSTHKPGAFIDRVFYVRQWRDPDGKVFGKNKLRVTTAAAFGRLLKGYRHEYECDEETEEAA